MTNVQQDYVHKYLFMNVFLPFTSMYLPIHDYISAYFRLIYIPNYSKLMTQVSFKIQRSMREHRECQTYTKAN